MFFIPVGRKNSKQIEEALEGKKNIIRRHLGKKVHLKYVPELRFIEANSL